jgi:hypothetical protein
MEPADDDAILEAELRSLDRTLRALPEPAMQRERLLERLEAATPAEAYALVAAVMRRPGEHRPHLLHLRDVLQDLLREGGASRPLDPQLCAGIHAQAAQQGDSFVTRLVGGPGDADSSGIDRNGLPRDVAEIPLGVRRALARGVDLPLLEKLLLDADPTVIDHLLANPRITEEHVVRIAARRPIPASTLDRIQRSRRFGPRPRVRTAVARNPHCPTPLAIQLLGTLPRAAVREMAGDATLAPETRRHARAELDRRDPR